MFRRCAVAEPTLRALPSEVLLGALEWLGLCGAVQCRSVSQQWNSVLRHSPVRLVGWPEQKLQPRDLRLLTLECQYCTDALCPRRSPLRSAVDGLQLRRSSLRQEVVVPLHCASHLVQTAKATSRPTEVLRVVQLDTRRVMVWWAFVVVPCDMALSQASLSGFRRTAGAIIFGPEEEGCEGQVECVVRGCVVVEWGGVPMAEHLEEVAEERAMWFKKLMIDGQ